MRMRVCVTPRWGGGPDDDWYPWLRRELRDHDVMMARLRPTPGAPTIEACVEELRGVIGDDREVLARTVLVGHSVGCQATLRFLESLPDGARALGVLCVAGWWWVDQPWETIRPWIERPLDRARVRRAAGPVRVLISEDDPFTSDHAQNARQWEHALGAEVTLLEGARHLNRVREPAVLEALETLLAIPVRANAAD